MGTSEEEGLHRSEAEWQKDSRQLCRAGRIIGSHLGTDKILVCVKIGGTPQLVPRGGSSFGFPVKPNRKGCHQRITTPQNERSWNRHQVSELETSVLGLARVMALNPFHSIMGMPTKKILYSTCGIRIQVQSQQRWYQWLPETAPTELPSMCQPAQPPPD